eukprot:m.37622 g.37622  ORF g.37622 m.37622 type:complete len:401 (+) comp12524_c0_seq1:36-1238(+)
MTMSYNGNIDFTQDMPPVSLSLTPCPSCGRTFNEKALSKHAPICAKASNNSAKRGTFSASKQRINELEVKPKDLAATTAGKSTRKPAAKPKERPITSAAATGKKAAWRAKHEEFIANIRAARKVTAVLNAGGSIADLPPPPPSENPDYVQCPTCSRRFNEGAANRHMPFCADKAKRESLKSSTTTPKSAAAKKRTTYKPPLPRSRTSSASKPHSTSAGRPPAHQSSSSSDDRPVHPAKPPSGLASSQRMVRRAQSPRVRRAVTASTMAVDGNARSSSHGSHLSTTYRTQHRSSYDDGSESSVSPSPSPQPTSDALARGSYPFDRERPSLDDAMIDSRARPSGSASSSGRNPLRIGSAARPKFCSSCGDSLLTGPKNFCSECGERFDTERGKFCSHCGTRR